MSLSRRQFIAAAGAGAVGSMLGLGWAATDATDPVSQVDNPLKSYPNRDWEDVYRDIYAYDAVDWTVCHPNCTQSCAMNFYMKNGVPIRVGSMYEAGEEAGFGRGEGPPGATEGYEAAGVSQNWNPRGCMQGLTLHRRTYEPNRIKYPMVRKGWDPDDPNQEGRGEDEFERVSWDEALELIARKLADLEESEHFHMFTPIRATGMITRHGALSRLLSLFGGVEWGEYCWYADLPVGHPITTGYQTSDVDAADWRNADYTIIQGQNLIHKKLADNHWFQEAREHGGKIVGVTPDYCGTIQKCDRWLAIRPGSDPALPLGVAHVIIDNELYDEAFMREFTSLPLLVREDTDKYLRAHEVFPGREPPADDEEDWGEFVVLGPGGDLHPVDRESVGDELDVTPRLDAETSVSLADGGTVAVRTDFRRQKENVLENYDPETVAEITTIDADAIRKTAREFAAADRAQWITGEGQNHWFNSNGAVQRAIFFVQAMLGNIGEAGTGCHNYSGQYKVELIDGYPEWINPDGHHMEHMYAGYGFAFFGGERLDPHDIRGDFDGELELVPQGDADEPVVPEGADTYTVRKPEVLWVKHANLLNCAKNQEHVVDNFVKHPDTDNELLVVSDMHMTYTARHADIVLPVPSWLECEYPDITVSPGHPFIHLDSGVMDPVYDTKQDGQIVAEVAEKLDEVIPPDEREVSYASYFEEFLREDGDPTKYIQDVLDAGITTQGMTVEDLRDGPQRLQLKTFPRVPFYSQVHEDRPFYTKTGRMEFHKEEDSFIELGRDDLCHFESPEGTPYGRNAKWEEAKDETNPLYEEGKEFYLNTPHPKYRTHTSFGMTDWVLIWESRDFGSVTADPEGTDRLVDDFSFPTGDGDEESMPPLGEAFCEIHPDDADRLGITNGDYVRLKGDRSSTVVRARVAERQRPTTTGDIGQITLWHGWWPQQLPDDEENPDDVKGYNTLTNIWIDPALEDDGMVHKSMFGDPNVQDEVPESTAWKHGEALEQGYAAQLWSPVGVNRDTIIEVEKYEEADWWPGDARRDDLVEDYVSGQLQRGD